MLSAPSAAPTRTRRRRSRAKPRPPRPRAVVMAELRGLGGLVLEQALLDAGAEPIPSLVAWANRLAGELGVQEPGTPPTYRAMMRALVDVNRRAEAAPASEVAA